MSEPTISLPAPSSAEPQREYRLHKVVGSITGDIPLYDLIDISTVTGNIDIRIEPHPGTNPAIIRVSTETGYIRLGLTEDFLQNHKDRAAIERQFETSVNVSVGTVSGTFLVGNGGMLDISALATASIDVVILTTGASPFDGVTEIATLTSVGSHIVKVESLDEAYPVTNIRATHVAAGTSSLHVEYPPEWIGQVNATAAGLGFVEVSGEKLTYLKSKPHQVIAYRGSSAKENVVRAEAAGTGSVYFRC